MFFLNFPETLSHAHGNYTPEVVRRAGKIVGSLGRAIDALYSSNVVDTTNDSSYRKRHNYHEDVAAFIAEYKEDNLFDFIPGRQHDAFPDFQYHLVIPQPDLLKKRLLKYSAKLDRSRH